MQSDKSTLFYLPARGTFGFRALRPSLPSQRNPKSALIVLSLPFSFGAIRVLVFLGLLWPRKFLGVFRDQESHDSQRRDRILRSFVPPEIRQNCPHFGAVSLLSYTINLEKREKIHWRKFKKIQWRRRPAIADFCPLPWPNASWVLRAFSSNQLFFSRGFHEVRGVSHPCWKIKVG